MNVDESPRRKDAAGFPILPLIEDSPPVELPKKKSKKRKGDDMDVDPEEEEEAPRKKVKLSKEEKKALKKELKRKRKKEVKASGVRFFSSLSSNSLYVDTFTLFTGIPKEREKREKGKEGKKTGAGSGCGRNHNGKAS